MTKGKEVVGTTKKVGLEALRERLLELFQKDNPKRIISDEDIATLLKEYRVTKEQLLNSIMQGAMERVSTARATDEDARSKIERVWGDGHYALHAPRRRPRRPGGGNL